MSVLAPQATAQTTGVTVKRFGAVGDGIADDTKAIQAAVDAVEAIYLPAGTYRISAPIRIQSGRQMSGGGSASCLKNATEDVERMIINADPVNGNTGIVLRDFRIDGSRVSKPYKAFRDGIFLTKCIGCRVEGMTIDNFLNDGLIIEYGDRNIARANVCAGNAKAGIYLSGASGCSVIENHCNGNGVGGIAVSASRDVDIRANICTANGVGDLVLGRDDQGVRVIGNRFGPGSPNAIVVSGESLASGPTLHGISYPAGDRIYGCRACVIRDNELTGKVALILFDDGEISGNLLTGSQSQGLLLHGSSRNRVQDNRIVGWGARYAGIQLAAITAVDLPRDMKAPIPSDDNIVRNNRIFGAAYDHLAIANGGARNRITENLVKRAS